MLTVPFVDALLALLRDEFITIYQPSIYEYKKFDDTYKLLLARAQRQATESKNRQAGRADGKPLQTQVCTFDLKSRLQFFDKCQYRRYVTCILRSCLMQNHSIKEALTQSQDSDDSDDTENIGLNESNIIAEQVNNTAASENGSRTAFNTDALVRRAKGKGSKSKGATKSTKEATKSKGKKVCTTTCLSLGYVLAYTAATCAVVWLEI